MKSKTTVLKQLLNVAFIATLLSASAVTLCNAQTSGITESSLVLNINNGGNTFYDLQAITSNADFNATNLGTFMPSQSIILSGAQQKTYKCGGCNIAGSTLYYRVYPVYTLPGSFININIPLLSNDTGGCGGDQTWQLATNATNILNGLSSGIYYLEVYTDAPISICASGANVANNGGLNYKATFTVSGVIAQYAGNTVASTVTAMGTANALITVTNGTMSNLCSNPVNIMRVSAGTFNQSSPINYIQFTIKPQPGYQFSVTAIRVNSRKTSGAPGLGGPNNGRIDYNANNAGFVQGNNYLVSTTTTSCTSTVPQQSVLPAGVVITDTVNGLMVRAYYWVNTSATGALDFSNLSVEGIVSEVNGPPKIAVPAASAFAPNTAVLGATIISNSGAPVTERGTILKTAPGATLTDNKLAEGGTGLGAFSHTRSALNPQALYYYAGYATNAYGTSLTAESSFHTRSKTPLTAPTGLTGTPLSYSSISLDWTGAGFPTSGATQYGYLIIYSAGTPSINNAPNGLPPAAVVANGTLVSTTDVTAPAQPATTATVTGLKGNTLYSFLVVPYTWNGTNPNTYNYLIAGAPVVSVATLPTNYLWIGTGTSSWNSAANWQPNGVPADDDAVAFNNSGTVTVTNVPNVTLTSLSVSGTSAVTLMPPTNAFATLSLGSDSTALSIAAGASLALAGNGANNITISLTGNVNNAIIDGTLSLLKGTTGAGIYNASDGNTTVNGVLVQQSYGAIISSVNDLSFNTGSKFQLTGNGLIIPTAKWKTGSTCEIAVTAGGELEGLDQTFSNFKVNCPGLLNNIQCNGSLVTINDTLTIANTNHSAGKSFALTSTTPYILNLKGDLIINDNACLDITNGKPISIGTATINLKNNVTITGTGLLDQSGSADAFLNFIKPGGDQVITLAGNNSISQSEFSATVNIGNGNTTNRVKLNSNVSLGNFYISDVIVNNGSTLDFDNYVLSGSGSNINVLPGAILRIGSTNGITASAASGNIQLSGNRVYSSDAIYTYSGNTNQVTGDGLPASVNTIIIENTGTTGNNTVSLTDADSTASLTLASGLFNPNGKTQTIKQNGILNAHGGNFSTSATGTVAFSAGTVTGIVDFYPDVTIKGNVDFGSSSTIYGLLQLNSGGYVTGNAPVYASNSILKYNTGNSYPRGLEWSATTGAGFPYNVQVSNNTSVDLSANGWANRSCAGYLNIVNGCSLTMGAMTNYLNVGTNLVLDGSLALATGAINGGNIRVGGNWTKNTNGVFTPNNRTVYVVGTLSSNINGTAPGEIFDYLIINKTGVASVTINKDITVQKNLTFTSGIINTTSNKVIIPQTGTITRTQGHVNGNLQKFITTGGPITQLFEVGDTSFYAPVSVRFAAVNTAGNLTVNTHAGDHPNIASTVFDGAKTINRYWTITNAGVAFTNYSPTFNYNIADIDAGVLTDSVFCGRTDSVTWSYPAMGVRTPTSAKVATLTKFGDFQLGIRCTSPLLSASVTNVSCRNGNNGTITLNATAGSPPFKYLWSNGTTTKDLNSCAAGTYTVTVTGLGGCSATVNAVVTQPATGVSATASNNTPICSGATINLTGTGTGGTGIKTFSWTGPNGFTSTVKNPVLSNSSGAGTGIYQVKVTDASNCTVTNSTSVVVNTVTPSITGVSSFCAGSSTILTAGSYSSYLWSNGLTTSNISVTASNTYTVTVTAANGCTGSSSLPVTVIPVLTPSITISANAGVNICTGSSVTFTASINNGGNTPTYQWKKNNVVVGTNSPTYSDAALSNGDIIKCLLSCPCATQNPVTSNALNMIVSQPIPVSAGNGSLIICGTGTATLSGKINNASSGYSATWSTTSGAGNFSNTAWNGVNGVTYTASVSDSGKTVYLVLTGPVSGSCAGSKDSVAIDVRPPVGITAGIINSVCEGTSSFTIPYSSVTGSPVEYTLMASAPNAMQGFVNQISLPLSQGAITASIPSGTPAGLYNFTLQVAKPPCQSVLYNLQLTINANPVISVSASPAAICQGSSTNLTATGASGYSWMPGILDGDAITVAPSFNTIYTVTGTSAIGCSSTNIISITVNSLPLPFISGNSTLCYGTTTVLNAGLGYSSYLWSNGATLKNIVVGNPNTYTVTVTNANNCSASTTKQISVLPQISVTATANLDTIAAGDTVLLNANAAGSVSGISYTVASTTFAPISGTGTKVTLGDDQMSGALPIGFNFLFYGTTYNNFYISSNGFITFNSGSNDGCCQGPPIPNNNNGNVSNIISLAWNDLTAAGGTVDYFTTGIAPNRKLVARFNIFHINGDPVITQAILFEGTNYIEIHSTSIPNMLYADPSYISTMGVENIGGTIATTVPGRNGAGWAATNDAWKFTPYASYNYSWGPLTGIINANIKNPAAVPLSSTTYIVTATAYNGCTGTASKFIYVNQPGSLTVFSSATSINCNAGTANVTINALGGVPPYSGTGSFAVNAGTYTYTVTDVMGNTSTANVTINQPPLLVASSSATAISCNGGSATVTVSASGGTPPYSGAGTFTVTAGTYSYTITDAKGCTSITTVIVSQPNVLAVTSQATPINCYGALSTANVAATGGTTPYSGTGNYNVNAGTYTYTVTDVKGCSASTAITINQPAPLVANCYAFTTVCYGDSSTVTIIASGGTPPYTGTGNYKVPAGTYNFVVTDSKGCTSTTVITINQLSQILSTVNLLQNVSCYGKSDGKITVTASNGSAPYIYLWNNGATTKLLTGLTAGTYTVNIMDNNGCSISQSYSLTQPDDIIISGTSSNISCNGAANGSVGIAATGGVSPYIYLWNNGNTLAVMNSLSPATYKVTVTDASGCTTSSTFVLTQPPAITATGNSTNVSCFGDNNGTTSVNASGGTAPYSYSWSNGSTLTSLTGLTANNYTVTIIDANGCSFTKTNSVTEPALLAVTDSETNVSCNGGSNGKATAFPTGGSMPYTYQWSNGVTNKVAGGLVAGTYTITVTDNHGCTQTNVSVITQPTLLTATCNGTNITCNGMGNGSININASGGTMPYTYLWSNGATTTSINNLVPGFYTIMVTDMNACKVSTNFTIAQPAVLSATITSTNINCYGSASGSASITPSGGTPPYAYAWNTGAITTALNNQGAGTYTVTVTDAKGCSATKSTILSQPALLVNTFSQVNVTCNGFSNGSATANITGGSTPYSYLWNIGATTKTAGGLAAGTYTVTVTDNKGCINTGIIAVTQPTVLINTPAINNVTCNGSGNGSIISAVTGGTAPYSYLWNGANTTSSLTGLSPGNYTVTVTDGNGCTNKITSSITQPSPVTISGTGTNITCFGAGNGSASAITNGGTSPYTYLWNTSAVTSLLSNLLQGAYTVTVTDSKGCTANKTYNISEPVVLSLTTTQTNVLCNGANTGSATANPSGGNMPYSYLWNTGATTKVLGNIGAGNYTVTVVDNKGCTVSLSTLITENPPLAYMTNLLKNVSCNGGNNGKIDLSVTGGVTPYTYSWSNGATTKVISVLSAGSYTITTTDNKGCTKTGSYPVTEPPILAIAMSKTNPSMGGNNGTATGNPSGGTSPYTYSWNTSPIKTTATISGLGSGTYTITVTDFNGCTQTGSVTLVANRYAADPNVPGDLIINVMPNPNNGQFMLKINSISDGYAAVQLTDATSRIVYNEKISLNAGLTEKSINVSSIAKGIYLLKVTTDNKWQVIQLVVK
ncbi:MAG: T9SS type A sorting domain-containing protein [Bacteroidia bacterium]